jgi:isocitrate/isopropylmalate dehydrogenase
VLETVREGTSTSDLGGHSSTTEFTDAVISKIKSKLDVWATL